MKIATWNVNSLRARHDRVLAWLRAHEPDVLCMQETKVPDESFPLLELTSLGYHTALSGKPTYNGVAIASRVPADDVVMGLEGTPDDKRFIAATIAGIRVLCAYVPNGGHVGSDKHEYKLLWLDRLLRHLQARCDPAERLALCGDFNVAPEPQDVHDPTLLKGDVCFHESVREPLARIAEWGLVDVYRRHHHEGGLYSWWDYRARGFARNRGMRLDHIWATPPLAASCNAASIDREERGAPKPSDHAPVVAVFDV